MPNARHTLSACFGVLLLATTLAAQCADSWQPGGAWDAAPSLFATTTDGDLIAAGDFTVAGGVACTRIARRVGSQWTPLGAGLSWPVTSLATMPDGDVVAVSAGVVQRWDGNAWSPLPLPELPACLAARGRATGLGSQGAGLHRQRVAGGASPTGTGRGVFAGRLTRP